MFFQGCPRCTAFSCQFDFLNFPLNLRYTTQASSRVHPGSGARGNAVQQRKERTRQKMTHFKTMLPTFGKTLCLEIHQKKSPTGISYLSQAFLSHRTMCRRDLMWNVIFIYKLILHVCVSMSWTLANTNYCKRAVYNSSRRGSLRRLAEESGVTSL